MARNRLIERAEVYEGIAATLRKGLAQRRTPRNVREQRDRDRLERQLREAEGRAAQLRAADRAIKEREV